MAYALEKVGAEAKNELIQLVSFSLDNEEFGVEVLRVREIIRMIPITHMPNAPYHVEGIINLRGKVIPVVSMRKKFNMMELEENSHTRIIVMDVNGALMGFIVDSVSEVLRVAASEIQPPPQVVSSGIGEDCISGVINRGEQLLIMIDLEKLVPQEEASMFS